MAEHYLQYWAEIDKLTNAEIKWLETQLRDIDEADAGDQIDLGLLVFHAAGL